jgi:RimJ/RimL family protein N-acetyltransferase
MEEDPILATERLTIRWITENDAPLILALMNDPDFIRYVADRGLRTVDDARRYIEEKILPGFKENGFGMCVVELKSSARPIGTCGIFKRQSGDDPEIGFAFLREFWGQGFACEAAAAIMDYGRNVLKLAKIVALTNPNNASSIKLVEKLGLRFERVIFDAPSQTHMNLYTG